MTNEEMQKTIEFILEQQAQFITRMGRDELRLTRLEDAFVTLVNIARVTDERLDDSEAYQGNLSRSMAALAEAQVRTDAVVAELAVAQKHTDERLNALIDVVERYISKGSNGSSPS